MSASYSYMSCAMFFTFVSLSPSFPPSLPPSPPHSAMLARAQQDRGLDQGGREGGREEGVGLVECPPSREEQKRNLTRMEDGM